MEPITHFLTGACIGRAGLNRKTAYATLVAVLTAEAADIDVLWAIGGPVDELKHHRGITHTLIAAPFVAAATVGVVWLYDRWRTGRRLRKAGVLALKGHGFSHASEIPLIETALAAEEMRGGEGSLPQGLKAESPLAGVAARLKPSPFKTNGRNLPTNSLVARSHPSTTQPIHWGWLYLTALLSALSHLLLDWTNNYGLRPFFPFNGHWYAGSLVFIVEPVLLVLLGSALVIPALLGLIGGEIGARRPAFRGRGWAIFALTGMVLLWGWRWSEQGRARMLVENEQVTTAPVKRMALEPYPINPFRWHAILETDGYYQTAEVNSRTGEIASDPSEDLIFKPPVTPAVEAAKQTFLGQVYLDWGSWAVVRDVGPEPIPGRISGLDPPRLPVGRRWTTVEFEDLRFEYPFLGFGLGAGRSPNPPPLSGWVYIVDDRDDAGEEMNGRVQR